MRTEFANGDPCPLEIGNVGVGFSNVIVDGGAKDDDVSTVSSTSSNSS